MPEPQEGGFDLLKQRHPEINWGGYEKEILEFNRDSYPTPDDILIDSVGNLWILDRIVGTGNRLFNLRSNMGSERIYMFIGLDGKRLFADKESDIMTMPGSKKTISMTSPRIAEKIANKWSRGIGWLKRKRNDDEDLRPTLSDLFGDDDDDGVFML